MSKDLCMRHRNVKKMLWSANRGRGHGVNCIGLVHRSFVVSEIDADPEIPGG